MPCAGTLLAEDAMEYRRLGNSGFQISVLGLGTTNFGRRLDADASARVLRAAVDAGVTFIDTADVYPYAPSFNPPGPFREHWSEGYVGQAIKGIRHLLVIATKVGYPVPGAPQGASRRRIVAAVEGSLRTLGTDYVDLLQVHFPDPGTPIEETLRALDDLVRQGKVRYIGCSNYAAWQVCEALWTSRNQGLAPFVSVQVPYNMLERGVERELVPFCRAYNMGILPYYPIAGGVLSGKYRGGQPPPPGSRLAAPDPGRITIWTTEAHSHLLERLEGFATERGHALLELAFAWLLFNPQVASLMAGAMSPEQAAANAQATSWRLTEEEKTEVDRLLASGP
jgi:aryl-alcohol dehydrogenase-like predicted oxidoreductase